MWILLWQIERFFDKLKQFRRVATRYDKLLANYMGFVKLAAIDNWFRYLIPHYGLAATHSSHRRQRRAIPAFSVTVSVIVTAVSRKANAAPKGQFDCWRTWSATAGAIIWKVGPPRRTGVA